MNYSCWVGTKRTERSHWYLDRIMGVCGCNNIMLTRDQPVLMFQSVPRGGGLAAGWCHCRAQVGDCLLSITMAHFNCFVCVFLKMPNLFNLFIRKQNILTSSLKCVIQPWSCYFNMWSEDRRECRVRLSAACQAHPHSDLWHNLS